MHIGRYKILRVFIYDTVAKPLRVQIDSLRPVRQVCSVLLLEIRNLFLARPFGAPALVTRHPFVAGSAGLADHLRAARASSHSKSSRAM